MQWLISRVENAMQKWGCSRHAPPGKFGIFDPKRVLLWTSDSSIEASSLYKAHIIHLSQNTEKDRKKYTLGTSISWLLHPPLYMDLKFAPICPFSQVLRNDIEFYLRGGKKKIKIYPPPCFEKLFFRKISLRGFQFRINTSHYTITDMLYDTVANFYKKICFMLNHWGSKHINKDLGLRRHA